MSVRRFGLTLALLATLLVTIVGPVAAAGAPRPLHTLLSPLGITKAEIHDARVRGISLDALATEQAVSREALIAALTAPHYARIDAAVAARVAAGAPVNEAKVAARKANVLALVTARVDRPLSLKTPKL